MKSCNQTCFQSHATYEAKCKECKKKREKAVSSGVPEEDLPQDYLYIGETSRQGCQQAGKKGDLKRVNAKNLIEIGARVSPKLYSGVYF